MANRKIAVLGGSFNPVHYGHVSLARNVVGRGIVDEVWLSLSPRNPFKSSHSLMPATQRLRLLDEALRNENRVRYTDIELRLPVPSYTIDALDALAADNPSYCFTLLIGADNLASFTHWKNWELLLKRYGIIVYPRGDALTTLPTELEPFSVHIVVLHDMPLYPISSTQIRQATDNFHNRQDKLFK